jgi:hypothetical protein
MLLDRADERVIMTLDMTGLALAASVAGTSWKTVKVRGGMLGMK